MGVTTVDHEGRIVDDFDVRVDSVPLHGERAIRFIEGDEGDRDSATVDEGRILGDTDDAPPSSRADQLAQFGLAKEIREDIAARARLPVDEHALGALVTEGGDAPVILVSFEDAHIDGTIQ